MIRNSLAAIAAAFLLLASPSAQAEKSCSSETFAEAVDKFGARLRDYNAEAQPRMRKRLNALADRKGWKGEGREERALAYLEDGRLGELDTQANDLLSKVDQFGRPAADGTYDCSKLSEIEAASVEILAVMKTKTAYLDDKISRELGPAPAAATTASKALPAQAPTAQAPTAEAPPPRAAAPKVETPQANVAEVPPVKPAPTPAPRPGATWDTNTHSPAPAGPQPPSAGAAPSTVGEPYSLPPVTFDTSEDGYTIDEIREATRGFFGTISTSLASVIEHAFASAGRPTGYILGNEGGGAFLAGLRYGKGTLYLRQGGTQQIHWHGPSLGYDFGAEGGRSLILIYRMTDPSQLYRNFTGVDGSAYLVGGVGMTLLKGGDVIMAPIRSGIGLRLGANIGYLRFTDRPTWNPF
jgi:hypothetical protein